jgi:hypothetical protein
MEGIHVKSQASGGILHMHRNRIPHETLCRTVSHRNVNRLDTAFFIINTKKRDVG